MFSRTCSKRTCLRVRWQPSWRKWNPPPGICPNKSQPRIPDLKIKSRLPSLNELAPVYGIISLFVYSWTIVWFFWKLNGWLVYLNLGEIGMILIYSLATNLLESLFVLSVPGLVGMVLPG